MNTKIVSFIFMLPLFFMVSCKKQEVNLAHVESNNKLTEIVFTESEFDFGTIKQGDKVMHDFTLKNTGKNDLIISRAMGSCGCTIPEYPKEPILPGKSAKMKVSFNSAGKKGMQQKTVSVYANVPKGGVTITIKANIKI